MSVRVPASSKEYIFVPLKTVYRNGVAYNPTGDPVSFSFTMGSTLPDAPTWYVGSWATINSVYNASCLLGPGTSVILAKGVYRIFVKVAVTEGPEIPVFEAPNTLEIY